MLSQRRSRPLARPRQIAMALSKELTNHSLPEIGEAFGGRDHTTVIHACEKTKELIQTNLEIEEPEPFIKNFKFIKGFKEGKLIYEGLNYEGKTKSNLKIIDFKVQEVPLLAKLLTLASLQGIADLLTGEGIRFTDFEMEYETLGNNTKIFGKT